MLEKIKEILYPRHYVLLDEDVDYKAKQILKIKGYQLSKRSLGRLKGVEPLLIAIIVDAIKTCPHDFGIPNHGGLRTASEQNSLFKIKPKITNCDGYNKKSYHQSGRAFDIYGYVNGRATWNKAILTAIAKHLISVAKDRYNVTLEWGGNWKNKDYPHFQVKRNQL